MYFKIFCSGEFEKKVIATAGAVVYPIVFKTTRGPIRFHVWDTCGQEKYGGVKQDFFEKGIKKF